MKKNLTIGLIVLFILTGVRLFAQDAVIKENRPVSSFSAIEAGGLAHVYLTKGETEKVDVEVNSKEFNDRLIVEVVNGVLVIRMKNEKGDNPKYGNLKARINVTYKTLNKIAASGVTHIYGQSLIEADKVDINLSGVSQVKLEVKAREVSIESSGTSQVTLTGNTKSLLTKTSGVASIKAYDLAAEEVISQASGASNIFVSASKTLNAKASGASNVNYKGDAKVTNNESSVAAHVRKM